ncbi:MAG: galactokinase [Dehalococcoidia bacterium]
MVDAESLRSEFSQRYGTPPSAIFRAPGRVNLIGEHTDYCGLPVLPIAINRSTFVGASATNDGIVRAYSTAFPRPAELPRNALAHQSEPWHEYLAGVLRELAGVAPGNGANLYFDGDLPSTGGLSSSSAFSVGAIAALSAAWGAPLPPAQVAELATTAERRVGVETGGMDQLVITQGKAGNALRIDFLPLATRLVPIADGLSFVVAYSGEEAPKGGAMRDAYNERVVGTRIAALMLADKLGVELEGTPLLGNVAEIDAAPVMVDELPVQMAARAAANTVESDVSRLVQFATSHFDSAQKVPVRRLAQHVLSESERVDEAERALTAGDLKRFGTLLNESHDSLRNNYQCSTPALDKVAAAMRKAGAFGARLTGAGFGGYAVAACPPEAVEEVIASAIAATGGPAFEVVASDGLESL